MDPPMPLEMYGISSRHDSIPSRSPPHVRDIVSQHIFSRVPFFILPLQPTAILYVLRHL